ncbi:anthranilate synthase component I family protein [Neobacillus notoginsengisoli]|uniref:Anthranilate synthase component I family protein n=1 Tax=Neobacillus notoginsengisoli TaxID=1578198 RepID=A0A417YG90_9BACI|nr:anthranilate synthase component I family protein [Neobacillus notoginsengisoli]RHW31827.1 anthranilate synthase component I family protein [Neobacillus notoginsengisoli]
MGVSFLGENIYNKKIGLSAETFFQQYKKIAATSGHHVLLESGRGGRYNLAAFEPHAFIKSAGANRFELIENGERSVMEGNPLHGLKKYMANFSNEAGSPIPLAAGGAIGYINYDYARYIESLPELATDELNVPDVYFMFHKEWFVFDLKEEVMTMFFRFSEEEELAVRVRQWEGRWTDSEPVRAESPVTSAAHHEREVSIGEKEFTEAVEKVREYIAEGDVFQVNLSVRQTKPIDVSALAVYEKLRAVNPSPYMGYFHTPEFQLVSGSPELLVKKFGREISTRPIAGTRSRGRNEEEDFRLASELIESEKERAEHVMLVDLERNDLGKVSAYGTVQVNEFMAIEKYSHVMHIVSNIRGEISPEKDGFDLIDAVFPGGTITGAPKVRTMEIIEELEPSRRGPYTGSLGWIGFNGDLELNIMIRTMLVKDGQAHVQAGAGIVIDSNPKHEYEESLKKARALWKAKELAEAGENE